MEKINLTKREYLGEGYAHIFEHIETGEKIYTSFDKETYLKMGGENGNNFNPEVPKEYKWVGSVGGYIKVDSPTTFLGVDEYTIVGEKYLVAHANEFDSVSISELTEVEFNKTYESKN